MTMTGNGDVPHNTTWAAIMTMPGDGTLPDDRTQNIFDASNKSVTGDGTHNESVNTIDVASPQDSIRDVRTPFVPKVRHHLLVFLSTFVVVLWLLLEAARRTPLCCHLLSTYIVVVLMLIIMLNDVHLT
jgi:hypothetical protein